MNVLAVLVTLVVVAAVYTAVRHRVLGRLAWRSASRRRTEAVLVILGSLLGTAIITGSLIVGDTLHDSVRSAAWSNLGPIDETVTAYGSEALPALQERLAGLPEHRDVDGLAFGLRSSGTIAARYGADDAAARPDVALLELDFDRARNLGGDPAATGLDGVAEPVAGEVVLTAEVAEHLSVDPGDEVTIFAYGAERSVRVSAVVDAVGVAGYPSGRSAFLVPGTIAGMLAEAPEGLGASPPISLAFVSNEGGVLEGAERSDAVVTLVRERIASLQGAEVDASKMRVLEEADETGRSFAELFLTIGAFAVIAGALLLVNIFVMLAEERKAELGMMRAVGMRRGALVRAFLVEGSLYGLVAAALGAVLGIGVGRVIVFVASGIFSSSEFGLDLRFSAAPGSLVIGLLAGIVISSVTVLGTAVRVSRLNIIRAIRELPEPPNAGPRPLTFVLGALAFAAGGAWTAVGVAAPEPFGALGGPGLLALGTAPLLARFVPRRPLVTGLGLAVVAWGVFAMTLFDEVFADVDPPIFVLQGVLLTSAAVAVLANNQDVLGRLLRRIAGNERLPLRLGLAYPLARRFRTSATLAMYALVVFTLVFISILAGIFGGQVDTFADQERGGYDIVLRSSPTDPVPADRVASDPEVSVVATLRYAVWSVEFRPEGREKFVPWAVSGFDQTFLDGGAPPLQERAPDYATDEEAWAAVLADPSLIVIDSFFLEQGGPPEQNAQIGQTVSMRNPLTGAEEERVVAARSRAGFTFSGVFASAASVDSVLGSRATPNRMYVAAEPGVDADALAARLQAELVRFGAEADTFHAIVARNQQANQQFFRLMQGYLALGLAVGISGLGVIMIRAVRERRREVGVLRALGLQANQVRAAFLIESGFVALQGILVGMTLALITSYQVIARGKAFGDMDAAFIVPWPELAMLLGITLLASLAATAWPARAASRIDPAVALRTAD